MEGLALLAFVFAITAARTDIDPFLQPADLTDAQLVPPTEDWRNPETARWAFRETWCKREGLPMTLCGHLPDDARPLPDHVLNDRKTWCDKHDISAPEDCTGVFAARDCQFQEDRREDRQSYIDALPAQSADLRGAKNLSQHQLDRMTGNAETLLPLTLDDGKTPSIPTCWKTPSPLFDTMIETMATRWWSGRSAEQLRAEFLCPPGEDPQATGTPLAPDAPYPDGYPLAGRD